MIARLFASLALLVLGAGVVSCGRGHGTPSEDASAPVTVTVQTAAAVREPARLDVTGEVVSRNRFEIASKVAGRIVSVAVEEGAAVRQGEVLLRIDAPELEAAVAQSRAALEAATLDLEMATRQSERFRRLAADNVVTARDLEMTLVAEAGASARHEGAKAAAHMSEENLGYAVLRAPASGRVVRRLARAGDLAAPGRPLLEMEDAQVPEVRVTVPTDAGLLPVPGMPAEITVNETVFNAVVERVVPAATGHVYEAYLRADGLSAPSGSFVRAALLGPEQEALRVPPEAMIRRGELAGVFLAVEGRAVLRWLRLATDGAVLAGLSPGDGMILAPPVTLRDGDPVEVAQ